MRPLLAVLLTTASACATVRFIDQPIVWHERDDFPIAVPQKKDLSVHWSALRDIVFLPLDRALDLDYGTEAENVNALDEVGDSSWFEDPRRDTPAHRWRPRALSAEEVRRGPVRPEDEPVPPLTVWKSKSIGLTPGFLARDARGVRYLVKIDPLGPVGLTTATELVVSRLMWAAGWRVPALTLIDLLPEQLQWAPDIKTRNSKGEELPYTEHMHLTMLARAPRLEGGLIRVLASRWIEGESLGSFAYAGRRGDDANDRFRHENRRDLRGFGIVTAWVNDVDTLQNNTLDVYMGAPGRGHVVHYQQDVGGAFGTWAAGQAPHWMGHEGYFRVGHIVGALVSLGLRPRVWESPDFVRDHLARARAWPELGGFTAEHFDPPRWQPVTSNPAFDRQTRRDRYWGAKRVIAFNEIELRAAIEAGRYPPATSERLFEVLWARRRRIAEAYLHQVAALDYFRIAGEKQRLCFDDLYYQAGLEGPSSYRVEESRRHARLPITWHGPEGCIELGPRDGYRVLELAVRRERGRETKVRVHLIEDGTGRRIVGLER